LAIISQPVTGFGTFCRSYPANTLSAQPSNFKRKTTKHIIFHPTSKQLVEMMGGRIGVKSRTGRGSEFWFTAVFEKQPEGRKAKIVVSDDIKGKRVLIVDDNATHRYVLQEQLKSWGCRYGNVSRGMQALEELRLAVDRKDPYEIAIIDMQMPEIDGETVGKKIKQDPDLKNTILVLMTSIGQRGDAKRLEKIGFAAYLTKPIKQSKLYDCLAAGMDDYLSKPVKPNELSTILEKWISKQESALPVC
jgi:CheY-like chemotaxis protein